MEIPERLSKLKFHFLLGVALSLLVFSRIYLSPKLVDVAVFFGPLFLSTALFLLAVLFFGRTLPPAAADAPGEKAAEVILDLVTGEPIQVQVLQPTEEEEEGEGEVLIIKRKQTEEEGVGAEEAARVEAAGAESVESEQKM